MTRVAENHIAEVKELVTTYLHSKDEMEPIPREELLKRASEGSVIVIDVRPRQSVQQDIYQGCYLTIEDL